MATTTAGMEEGHAHVDSSSELEGEVEEVDVLIIGCGPVSSGLEFRVLVKGGRLLACLL